MQLVQQVRQALRVGMLEPGDQLPRVREVAESLARQVELRRELLLAWLGKARAAGLDPEDVVALFETTLRASSEEGVA
jgi:GntR family transcriptional regulator